MNFSVALPATRIGQLRPALVLLILVAAALAHLWQHQTMVDLGYQIQSDRTTLARLSHQRAELVVEVARLSALPRIERMATTQLGMTWPSDDQLVRVVIANPRPAPPATDPNVDVATLPSAP